MKKKYLCQDRRNFCQAKKNICQEKLIFARKKQYFLGKSNICQEKIIFARTFFSIFNKNFCFLEHIFKKWALLKSLCRPSVCPSVRLSVCALFLSRYSTQRAEILNISLLVCASQQYGPGFGIRGLGVQDSGLDQDPYQEKEGFSSIT